MITIKKPYKINLDKQRVVMKLEGFGWINTYDVGSMNYELYKKGKVFKFLKYPEGVE